MPIELDDYRFELDVLCLSLDYISDDEAKNHLSLRTNEVSRNRRSLGGPDLLSVLIRVNDELREVRNARRVQESGAKAKPLRPKERDTAARKVAESFRDLGLQLLAVKEIRQSMAGKIDNAAFRTCDEPIGMLGDVDARMLGFVLTFPIRALSLYSKILVGEWNVLQDMAELAQHLGLIDNDGIREIILREVELLPAVRKANRVALKYQGKGITLHDVPDDTLVDIPIPALLM